MLHINVYYANTQLQEDVETITKWTLCAYGILLVHEGNSMINDSRGFYFTSMNFLFLIIGLYEFYCNDFFRGFVKISSYRAGKEVHFVPFY